MRKFKKFAMAIALFMAFVFASTGCGGSNSAQDKDASGGDKKPFEGKTLVVGVWGGTIEEAIRKNVVEPLEAETGCKVELVLGGTGDRRAKIYAEKGNPSMDVAFLNIFESKQAIVDGVAEDVDPSLSNFNSLYPAAQKGGYGMSFMAVGIVYNTELVKEPIKEWKDLWRPELKGKIAFPNYPGFEGDAFIAATARAFGQDEQNADIAFEKLQELKPVPLVYTNLDELFLEMKQGNVLAAPIFNSYAYDYKDKGYPIDFAWPTNPGPIMAKDTIVITKGTKNLELAKKFVDYCISEQTQKYYAEKIFFGPVNKNVQVANDVAERIVYGEDRVSSLLALDWDHIISKQAEWTERWNREILSK